MKAIGLELIEDESRQNENSRFLSGITRSYPTLTQSCLIITPGLNGIPVQTPPTVYQPKVLKTEQTLPI